MKKNLLLIFLFALTVLTSGKASATSSTANATVNFMSPISITELSAYSFKISRKTGLATSTTVSSMSTSDPTALNYFANYPVAIAGCFKVTGAPSTAVNIQIVLPATIGPITLLSGNYPVGFISTAGCVATGMPNKAFNALLLTTLDSSGATYVSWGIATGMGGGIPITQLDAAIGLANLTDATYSAITTINVNY